MASDILSVRRTDDGVLYVHVKDMYAWMDPWAEVDAWAIKAAEWKLAATEDRASLKAEMIHLRAINEKLVKASTAVLAAQPLMPNIAKR